MRHILLALTISSLLPAVALALRPAGESFKVETKIFWAVETEVDGKKRRFEQSEIDLRNLAHKELNVRCILVRNISHIPYNAKTETYTRDEERVVSWCTFGDAKIDLEDVVCAHGHGRKGLGSVYGDSASVTIGRDKHRFMLKVSCVLK